jgi:LCP family protein required for cell wall assembly
MGWIGRHKALFGFLALVGVLFAGVAGWAAYLNNQIGDVPRIDLGLDEEQRPERATGAAADSLNILLAGADSGDNGGPSIAEAVKSGNWQPGSFRSDTIMILHITADRDAAYLISVPRDSWVNIPGHGMNKINAAFSLGGPSLYLQTMEQFSGLRMDHLAIIDWEGFRSLTSALGGVEVYIPETVTDPSTGKTWEQGTQTLAGDEALKYVRQRKGLANGDFDRIKRQQNFMRATMSQLLSQGTMSNPIKLTNALQAITSNLTVDQDFSNKKMRELAVSLRGLRTNDVTFITIPTECCRTINGQSTVTVLEDQTKALFGAVLADELDAYLKSNEGNLLGDPKSVS